MSNVYPFDSRGIPFKRPVFYLQPDEYSKIVSEINNAYYDRYVGKTSITHFSYGIDNVAYIYYVEVHGFDDYNIFNRVRF